MRYVALFFSLMVAALPAMAAPDHAAQAVKLTREVVIPRYEALAAQTKTQQGVWDTFCAAPKAADVGKLKVAFQAAADAWSSVEFVRYGPIAQDFRYDRMAHWPERKNAITRGLAAVLAREGVEDLTPERFRQTSVAVQGFSALERLLYDEGAESALLSSARRCAVGKAISAALAGTAADIVKGWNGPDGVAARLAKGDPAFSREVVTRLVTDALSMQELVLDAKLKTVLGANIEEARPRLAEGWRAGRSARAIVLNMESLRDTVAALAGDTRDGRNMVAAVDAARRIAEGLDQDIGAMAADPKQRARLVLATDAVQAARDLTEEPLPAMLDITVGFNSLDGD